MRYVVDEEGEEKEGKKKEEENEEGRAEEMKTILEEKMEEAWRQPEARAMRRKLSKVAKTHWKPQIEEAIKTTKYDKELESRAKEIDYSGKVKKVWK